jgi:hypothetical protein
MTQVWAADGNYVDRATAAHEGTPGIPARTRL